MDDAAKSTEVEAFTRETMKKLEASLQTDDWKSLVPGRVILQIFCSPNHANFDFGRFKLAYLKAAEEAAPSPFREIEEIFESFQKH